MPSVSLTVHEDSFQYLEMSSLIEQSHRPISQLLELVQHLGVGSQLLSQVWDKIRSASNAEGQRHSSDTFFLLKRR